MHVRNSNFSIMMEIPRQCNTKCRLVLSVQVLHAINYQSLGIAQSFWRKLLKNMGQFPQDLRKEIGAQVGEEINQVRGITFDREKLFFCRLSSELEITIVINSLFV